jgi:hypothetical protein
VITDWQIPGPNSFAHKAFSFSKDYPIPAGPGFTGGGMGTITEKTVLDLNQPHQ